MIDFIRSCCAVEGAFSMIRMIFTMTAFQTTAASLLNVSRFYSALYPFANISSLQKLNFSKTVIVSNRNLVTISNINNIAKYM